MIISKKRGSRIVYFAAALIYAYALYVFYIRYVPLVKNFQIILLPILGTVCFLTAWNLRWGTLGFIFLFPLINNLPYFFKLYEPLPMAPTALVLFLFYFFGWLIHSARKGPWISFHKSIFKPLIVFNLLVAVSAIITFFRYSNFFLFRGDAIYELVTNAFGVTAGGALMSVIFHALNYLSGAVFFLLLAHVIRTEEFLKKTLLAFGLSIMISMSFGLFQRFGHLTFGNNQTSITHTLINATFKDALSFGAFLSMVFPIFLAVFLSFKGFWRIPSFFILIPAGYLALFSGSKSGVLSLVAGLFLFAVLSGKFFFAF